MTTTPTPQRPDARELLRRCSKYFATMHRGGSVDESVFTGLRRDLHTFLHVPAAPAVAPELDVHDFPIPKKKHVGTARLVAPASAVADGVAMIAAERSRQISAEGWTPAHDDEHTDCELATAAACYAAPGRQETGKDKQRVRVGILAHWPWALHWWKPTPNDRVRELVKAGALIAAEIDRLQRRDGTALAAPSDAQPEWRCFHCDEVFTDHAAALDHFGPSLCSEPACKIDAAEYRRMEEQVRRCNAEDSDKDRAIYALRAHHAVMLIREEERGYAKGLADAQPAQASPIPVAFLDWGEFEPELKWNPEFKDLWNWSGQRVPLFMAQPAQAVTFDPKWNDPAMRAGLRKVYGDFPHINDDVAESIVRSFVFEVIRARSAQESVGEGNG